MTTALFSSQPFTKGLEHHKNVTIVYGTQDQFTSEKSFVALDRYSVKRRVVDGADHFFRKPEHAAELEKVIRTWVEE